MINGVPEDILVNEENRETREVVGWLECISGEEKGKRYYLYSGENYVGNKNYNEIYLPTDPTISAFKHCVVFYDSEECIFYFGLGWGNSFVRLNGKILLMYQELRSGDRLTIGLEEFLFVSRFDMPEDMVRSGFAEGSERTPQCEPLEEWLPG